MIVPVMKGHDIYNSQVINTGIFGKGMIAYDLKGYDSVVFLIKFTPSNAAKTLWHIV